MAYCFVPLRVPTSERGRMDERMETIIMRVEETVEEVHHSYYLSASANICHVCESLVVLASSVVSVEKGEKQGKGTSVRHICGT
jgi:hypothetical protein